MPGLFDCLELVKLNRGFSRVVACRRGGRLNAPYLNVCLGISIFMACGRVNFVNSVIIRWENIQMPFISTGETSSHSYLTRIPNISMYCKIRPLSMARRCNFGPVTFPLGRSRAYGVTGILCLHLFIEKARVLRMVRICLSRQDASIGMRHYLFGSSRDLDLR